MPEKTALDLLLEDLRDLKKGFDSLRIDVTDRIARMEESVGALRQAVDKQHHLENRIRLLEDEYQQEKGRRTVRAVVFAIGGGIAGAIAKTLLSYLPKLF